MKKKQNYNKFEGKLLTKEKKIVNINSDSHEIRELITKKKL